MVNLTRIYTRTGDEGETRLANSAVVPKTDPRLEACGAVDEANCVVGLALAAGVPDDVAAVLAIVQNELFDIGADLTTPGGSSVQTEAVTQLETWCDQFNVTLPVMRSFVLPGGTPGAAQLHIARTVVRRAERAAWVASDEVGLTSDGAIAGMGGLNPVVLVYLNRLSDLLFILARYTNQLAGAAEALWTSPQGVIHGKVR